MAGEQVDARHERRDHPEHQADADEPPEHRAEQQRELDVAHAHAGRVGERGHEQEAGGAERAERPLGARVERRLRDEHDRRRREDDPVRDDPVLEVDRAQHDEHDAEERGQERLARRGRT